MFGTDSIFSELLKMTMKAREPDELEEEEENSREAKRQEAIERRRAAGRRRIPDFVRITRKPYSFSTLSIEFLDEDENQGIIKDVPHQHFLRWLKIHGIHRTLTLERAKDAAWNFGECVYLPHEDEMVIPNEMELEKESNR